MKLYIQVENRQTVNHPAFEDNLIQAFGQIPSNWEPFIRVERPVLGVYEILDSNEPTYQKVNGTWADVWPLRPMTVEEKITKQQEIKDAWAAMDQASNWSAWIFNEDACRYDPPVPRPEPIEGKIIFWSGAENKWKEVPPYPQDGKQYKFDFFAWTWIEL